jgi:hypothetical protein
MKVNKHKKLVAQVLLGVFLFENCSQPNITPVHMDLPPAVQVEALGEKLGSGVREQNELAVVNHAIDEQELDASKQVVLREFLNKEECKKGFQSFSQQPKSLIKQGVDQGQQLHASSKHLNVTNSLPSTINLGTLNGTQGITIRGSNSKGLSGSSVSGAGDINGDGFADVIIGAPNQAYKMGTGYIVYGGRSLPSSINLGSLNGTQGITIQGSKGLDNSGTSVSGAGDINGDGFADIIIGAPNENNFAGVSYIVYGGKSLPSSINLGSLNGTQGVRIQGDKNWDKSGNLVSGAGDINGDGFTDVIIGTANMDNGVGASYIVYGGKSLPSSINLGSLNGKQGITIQGSKGINNSGNSVSGAGDINGDGFADVIIGTADANNYAGASYIVYGGRSLPSSINLGSLNGTQGVRIQGDKSWDLSGSSVSGAGDINGDGFADIIIGAPNVDNGVGASYIVYGGKSLSSIINLGSLNGTQGVRIQGDKSWDLSGSSVSGAGDINGDGFADVIIGNAVANNFAGVSYIVYGDKSLPSTINLGSLNATQGITIQGAAAYDYSGSSVSEAGDINGDDLADIIIGAPNVDKGLGASYIVYGGRSSKSNKLLERTTNIDKATLTHLEELKRDFYQAKSSASTPGIFWSAASTWVKSLGNWWNKETTTAALNMRDPHVQAMLKLRNTCQELIQEEASSSKDKWYEYSLEDMIADIEETLQNPAEIQKETISEFKGRLRRIRKDFLTGDIVKVTFPYKLEPASKHLEQFQLLASGINMLPYQGNIMPALAQ